MIEWLERQPNRAYKRKAPTINYDIRIKSLKKENKYQVYFTNKALAEIASETTYIEMSSYDATELHFRQYNKKPDGKYAYKIKRMRSWVYFEFVAAPGYEEAVKRWTNQMFSVFKNVSENTIFIRLEEEENGKHRTGTAD